MAREVIKERLALLTIVGVFLAYLIAPQAVAGVIWDTANTIVTYWQD